MPCWRSLPALLLLLLLLPGAPDAEVAEVRAAGQEVPPCPARCACYAPVEVHCTFRSLASFPAGVWRGVERVNLGYNAMTSLPASALAGLSRLRLLLLHGNEIEEIQDGALRDLGALQVLKLSYNRLRALTAGALRGARALTRLHLDHNRLAALDADALLGLTSLRLLTLEGNALASLPPGGLATFDLPAGWGRGRGPFRVSTLRHLSLAGNALTSLPPALLPAAPLLETLALHGNPWACDCARAGWVGAWTAGVRGQGAGTARRGRGQVRGGGVSHSTPPLFPAALRCKKDKDAEGGTSCPVCASPAHFRNRDLRDLGAADVTCASPALHSPLRKNGTRDREVDDDGDDIIALGGPGDDVIGLEMADAHGTRVTLACDPRAAGPPRVTDVSAADPEAGGAGLVVEAAVTLDLACAATRDGDYERTWRLLAYYGEVSAALAAADPEPGSNNTGNGGKDDITARYAQDPDDADALYYTGLRVNLTTPPEWAWLLAPRLFRLRLDRKRTTARRVLVTYEARLSRTLPGDADDVMGDADGDATPWVAIASDPDAGGVIAREGEDVRLPCDVTASATASVTWRLPDGAVATGTLVAAPAEDVAARARGDDLKRSRGSRVHDVGKAVPVAGQRRKPRSPRPDVTVLGDGSLLLRAARTDDAGRYVCAVSVGAAQDRATRRLVVTSRSGPSRDDDAAMLRATPGAVLTLPCAVSGAATAASLAWELPGGRLLRRGENASSGGAVVDGNGTLELTPLRGGDSGRFRCVAVNQAGSAAFTVEVAVDAAGARGDDAGADVTGGDAEEASGAGPGDGNRTTAGAELRAADEGDGDRTGGNRSSRTGSRKLAPGTGERQNRKSAAKRRKSTAATPEVTSLGPSPGQPWKLVAEPGAPAGREGRRGRRVHVTDARVLARVQGRNLPRAGGDATEATPTPGGFPSPAPVVAAETDAEIGGEALLLVTDAADVIGANDIIQKGDITVSRDDVIGGADIANASDVANRTGGGCANASYDIINCADVINASDIVNRTHDIINTTVANVSAPCAEEEEAAETEEEEESVEAPPLMFPGLRDVIPAPPPAPALRFQPGSNSGSSAGGDFQLWPASSASGSSEQRPRGGEFRFRTVGAFPPSRKGSRRRKWPWGIPLPTTSDPPTSGWGTTWGTQASPISDVTATPRDRRGRNRARNRGRQAPPPTTGPAQLQLPVPEAPPPELSSPRRKSGRKSGRRRTTASSRELEVVTAGGGVSASSPVHHAWSVTSLPVTSPMLGSATGAFADVTAFSLNDAVTKTATDDIIRGTEDGVTAQTATDDITVFTDDAVAGISTDDVAASTDDVTDATADDIMTEPEPDTMPKVGTDDVIHTFMTPDLVADLAPGTLTALPKETTGDVSDWSDITSDGVTTETPATPDTGDVTASASDDVTGDISSKSADDVITGAGDVIAHPARPLPDALSASGSAEAPPPPAAVPGLAPPPALKAETSRSDEEATSSQTPQQEVLVAAATVTPPPLPAVQVTSLRPRPLPVRPEVAEFPPPPPQAPPSFRFSLPRAGVTERSTPPLPPAPGIPLTPHFRPPRIHAHLGPPAPPASRGLYRVTSRDPAVALMTSSATSPARRPLVHVRRGSRLRLRCEAVGFPAPHVVWRLPSRRLLDRFAGPDPRVSVAPDGSLSVAPVTERDAGDYACLAGDASAAFTVHVLAGADPAPSGFASGSTYGKYRVAVRLAVTPDPPWRVADAATFPVISARVGSSVRVACRGAAGTASPVTWQLPDGTRVTSLTPTTSSPRARVDPRGWLALWPLAPGDAGLYRCWSPGGVTRAVVVRVD